MAHGGYADRSAGRTPRPGAGGTHRDVPKFDPPMKHTLAFSRPGLVTPGPGPTRLLPALVVACAALGCGFNPEVLAPSNAKRSNVSPPSITLSPVSLTLAAGNSAVITARTAGGEAMLFSVDWRVQEGAAGGSITGASARKPDGTFDAAYTAPRDGAGRFHVVATLHEYPSAFAVTSVEVVPRH